MGSGATSDEYFDKYLFESDPDLPREIAQVVVALLPDHVRAVAGLELGGVPLATVVSQLSCLPALFVRKQVKTYWTCRLVVDGEVAGRRLVVIEDVISSGGQVVASCRALRELGAEIVAVVCVLDRESGGAANLAEEGLELRTALTMTQVRSPEPEIGLARTGPPPFHRAGGFIKTSSGLPRAESQSHGLLL